MKSTYILLISLFIIYLDSTYYCLYCRLRLLVVERSAEGPPRNVPENVRSHVPEQCQRIPGLLQGNNFIFLL